MKVPKSDETRFLTAFKDFDSKIKKKALEQYRKDWIYSKRKINLNNTIHEVREKIDDLYELAYTRKDDKALEHYVNIAQLMCTSLLHQWISGGGRQLSPASGFADEYTEQEIDNLSIVPKDSTRHRLRKIAQQMEEWPTLHQLSDARKKRDAKILQALEIGEKYYLKWNKHTKDDRLRSLIDRADGWLLYRPTKKNLNRWLEDFLYTVFHMFQYDHLFENDGPYAKIIAAEKKPIILRNNNKKYKNLKKLIKSESAGTAMREPILQTKAAILKQNLYTGVTNAYEDKLLKAALKRRLKSILRY